MTEVTRILSAIEKGEPHAAEQLLPLVYHELRQLAAVKLAQEKPGQTLEATALVHEAYLRLVVTPNEEPAPIGENEQGAPSPEAEGATRWDNRGHFFAAAAEAMRRILVENARRKRSHKHGGGRIRQDLDEVQLETPESDEDLVALDEALEKLARTDPVKAELIKLRHFAGLKIEQAAQALGISTTTANRYWAYARAWLHQEMMRGTSQPPPI